MRKNHKSYSVVHFLLAKYRNVFGTPGERTYTSGAGFTTAERRFLRFALEQRRIELEEELYQRQTVA